MYARTSFLGTMCAHAPHQLAPGVSAHQHAPAATEDSTQGGGFLGCRRESPGDCHGAPGPGDFHWSDHSRWFQCHAIGQTGLAMETGCQGHVKGKTIAAHTCMRNSLCIETDTVGQLPGCGYCGTVVQPDSAAMMVANITPQPALAQACLDRLDRRHCLNHQIRLSVQGWPVRTLSSKEGL